MVFRFVSFVSFCILIFFFPSYFPLPSGLDPIDEEINSRPGLYRTKTNALPDLSPETFNATVGGVYMYTCIGLRDVPLTPFFFPSPLAMALFNHSFMSASLSLNRCFARLPKATTPCGWSSFTATGKEFINTMKMISRESRRPKNDQKAILNSITHTPGSAGLTVCEIRFLTFF